MRINLTGKYYLRNGLIYDLQGQDTLDIPEGTRVYEVLRIINGVPLFVRDHLRRMHFSATSAGLSFRLDDDVINRWISQLISKNMILTMNIRMEFIVMAGGESVFFIFHIPSVYPTDQMYRQGVAVGLFNWERVNPEAKIWHNAYKEQVANQLARTKLYELLLVDKHGLVTEGSRSNVFFIKGEEIFTAPDEQVLCGITRKYVLQVCRQAGLKCTMTALPSTRLAELDACFICGTSPKVLPVASIDGCILYSTADKILQGIMDNFNYFISQWLHEHGKLASEVEAWQ